MAKVSYANLKLKVDQRVETFDFGGQSIEVKQYLPIEDKYDLIMIALQRAEEDGIYNPVKVQLYFELYVVYMYSNISFTDKQKENEPKLYDTLASNGIIASILELIPDEEYNELMTYMKELIQVKTTFNNSAAGLVNQLLVTMPENVEKAAEVLNSFNVNDYKEVIEFAKAANGNRPIPVEG
jgi:hypothetical protein